jgi:hypothetical protein
VNSSRRRSSGISCSVVSHRLELCDLHRRRGLLAADPFAPEPVDRAVPRRREQPCGRVTRHAALRPRPERLLTGLLPGLLRQVEVVRDPDEGRDGAPGVVTVRSIDGLGDGGHQSMTGRTSIDPACTLGIRAAMSIAASRSGTSTRK